MTDGLQKGRAPIVEAACWAHVRRKSFDLHQAHRSPVAKEALERISFAPQGGFKGFLEEVRYALALGDAPNLLQPRILNPFEGVLC